MEELKKKKTSKKGFSGFFNVHDFKVVEHYFLTWIDIYKDKIYNISVNVTNEITQLSLNEIIFPCRPILLMPELIVISRGRF